MKKIFKVLIVLIFSSKLYSNSDFWTLVSIKDGKVASHLSATKLFIGDNLSKKFLIEAENGACLLGSHLKAYDDLFRSKSVIEYTNKRHIYKFEENLGEKITKEDFFKNKIDASVERKLTVDLLNNNLFASVLKEKNCKYYNFIREESLDDHPGAKIEFIYECGEYETSNTLRTYTVKTCSQNDKLLFEAYLSRQIGLPVKLNF